MKTKSLYTHSKARLTKIKSTDGIYNWLFLSGGPGLGSESLATLTNMLELPGNIWHLDLPGDGSNTTNNDEKYFANSSQALLEATACFTNVIFVAHSTGGMYALATKGLEDNLDGLVLLDSAPDSSWQKAYQKFMENIILPQSIHDLLVEFENNPTDELLKEITLAIMPYYLPKKSINKTIAAFKNLPFNCRSHHWSAENFDDTYQYQWVPQKIPTLILSGDSDPITPLELFQQHPAFQRPNIKIQSISQSGHFPWFDNPKETINAFQTYSQTLNSKNSY